MADIPSIPSIFNKSDFFGRLLPGYLTVFLFLLLFTPDVIFRPAAGITFDLLSTIVFLVAGPAVGLTLQQFHRGVVLATQVWLMRRRAALGNGFAPTTAIPPPSSPTRRRKPVPQYLVDYARVRLKATDAEKAELDSAEADYDFSLSVAVGLWFLASAWVGTKGWGTPLIPLLLAVGGVVFLLEAYWQLQYSVQPTVNELVPVCAARPYPAAPPPR